MNVSKRVLRIIGFVILVLMLIGYFIPIENVLVGEYYEATYQTSLLGILIFHNVWIFTSYVVVALVLIYLGYRRLPKRKV
tara:strand:- start:411 stop:650 length:240 start_codon:yes stop_codon:yes gene_type:complete